MSVIYIAERLPLFPYCSYRIHFPITAIAFTHLLQPLHLLPCCSYHIYSLVEVMKFSPLLQLSGISTNCSYYMLQISHLLSCCSYRIYSIGVIAFYRIYSHVAANAFIYPLQLLHFQIGLDLLNSAMSSP